MSTDTNRNIRIRIASKEANVTRTMMFYLSLPADSPEKRYTLNPAVAKVAAKYLGGRPADYIHSKHRKMFVAAIPDLAIRVKPVAITGIKK